MKRKLFYCVMSSLFALCACQNADYESNVDPGKSLQSRNDGEYNPLATRFGEHVQNPGFVFNAGSLDVFTSNYGNYVIISNSIKEVGAKLYSNDYGYNYGYLEYIYDEDIDRYGAVLKARFSPYDDHVVFASDRSPIGSNINSGLELYKFENGDLTYVPNAFVPAPAQPIDATYSPDGQYLVVRSFETTPATFTI